MGQEEAIQKALAYNDAEKQVYQILIAAWAQEKGFSFAKDEMTLRFSVPCLSEQILSVELKVAKTPGEAVRYELTAHTLEQPAGATDDEPLDVWQGNIRMLWG